MLGMNGIETLNALKKTGVQTQVVLVSATPKTQYVMESKELNAVGFVVKPMSAKVVSDAIAKCLKLAGVGEERQRVVRTREQEGRRSASGHR